VNYLIKRQVMRVRCLFGKHNYKVGVSAKTGGAFACLWCRKAAPRPFTYHRKSWSATNAPSNTGIPYVEGYQGKQGTQG